MPKFFVSGIVHIPVEMEIAAENAEAARESFAHLSAEDMGIGTGGRESWIDIIEETEI